MDIVFNVQRQLIEGKVEIDIQLLDSVQEIKVSAADMIWDMFSFHVEDVNQTMISIDTFHVLQGLSDTFISFCR